MGVDEYFVVNSLLRDAVGFMSGAAGEHHNLRTAISNSRTVPTYIGAMIVDKIIKGDLG
jgi:hypothetical protein